MAGSGQTVGRTIAGTDAGLIARCGDGGECRGIERESGNITAILPQAGEAGRAALPHPFRRHGAVDHAPEGHPPGLPHRGGWHVKCFMTDG